MIYPWLFVVLSLGAVIYLIVALRGANNRAQATQNSSQEELTDLNQALFSCRRECAILEERLASQAEMARITAEQTESAENRLRQQLATERARLDEIFERQRVEQNSQFTEIFKNLANDVLETKSQAMTKNSVEGVSSMLKPLAEDLQKFRERIEQESKQRYALEKEVGRLVELNMKISQQANNLTSALKGNSKTQGDWGEMILETLLESSGLKRDIHFKAQASIRNTDGELQRPDIILSLPDNKQVVIDSKVSLRSYIAYTEADEPVQCKQYLGEHIAAVRSHIVSLGGKSYQGLVDSPDFVIMFMPNEPAFLLALQGDATLWNFAYSKGVVLSSPTNLFAILRIVDELWRRDSQSKNAIEIARQGGELYDKFIGFAEVFSSVGAALDKGQEQYAKAFSMLSQGKGNLVRRAETIRKLGVKTSKVLPRALVDISTDNSIENATDTSVDTFIGDSIEDIVGDSAENGASSEIYEADELLDSILSNSGSGLNSSSDTI